MIGLESLIDDMRRFIILIAGEHGPDRRDVRILLQMIGFVNFREAVDGDDAIRKVRGHGANLVICDYDMPLIDGPQLLSMVRRDGKIKSLPLIMLASDEAQSRRIDESTPAPDGRLTRPLLPQTLEDMIARVLFKRLSPSPFDSHIQAAGAAMARERFKEAHAELDAAKKINPISPMVDYFRQLVYLAEERPDKARESVERARKLFVKVIKSPRLAEDLLKSGETLLDQNRLEDAAGAFAEAVDLSRDKAKFQMNIGEAYLARGMAREAEAMFSASIKENPDDVHLYNRLGIAYRRQKKLDEAVATYLKAIDIDPYEENLYYNLARAHLSAGDRDSAAAALKEAIKILPEFKEAQSLLSRITRK